MSDRKLSDRRAASNSTQDHSDLNSAITELHQTIVRLNKAIDRVHPHTKAEAQKSFGKEGGDKPLSLAAIKIPRTVH